MAEGLDEAVQAFQTELNPSAPPERARDSGGRFAAARPEPMFEPRPIEGDPLTGDTRDGGDDARLIEAERRIADGRGEEGDAEVLRAPRRAANDNQEAGNDNQPPAEELDEDGKPKAKPEGEGEEQEDEGPKYEVTVDGQTMEVSLKEALQGYQREAVFHKRMNQVHDARQAVEAEASHVGQARDYYVQRLQFLERVIGELTPPQPNWDEEFARDPRAAHEKQKAYQAIYGKVAWAQQEMQRTAQDAAGEYDRNSQRYAVEQFSQFVRDANIPDEKALAAEMSEMRAYAKDIGFSEGEIATVYDRRMLRVLRDAAKYRRVMASKLPKPIIPGQGKTLAPGVASPVGSATRRSLDEAQQKLARTGRTEDAALVFQRLIR